MSFRLNEYEVIKRVFESVPPSEIRLLVQELPIPYLQRYAAPSR
jgi:hypothetical protein